jgi:hypothetical protein
MDEENTIVNRVASSALVSFDLEKYRQPGERVSLDLAGELYQGLVLREKDFRAFIQNHDWTVYRDKYVSVHCSADAIVPTWAFMLVGIALQPFARHIVYGSLRDLEEDLMRQSLETIDWSQFAGAKVVVKGCSDESIPVSAYVEASIRLRKVANSVMFGEPCSTVPLFKRSR